MLETANPVKFPDSVEKVIGEIIHYPPKVEKIMEKKKKSIEIDPNYTEFKAFLLSEIDQ